MDRAARIRFAMCCALLAVQAIAALVLSYRLFLRLSSILQMAAFFALLGIYFLKPPYRAGSPGRPLSGSSDCSRN
ncbi:MAG: hypothetical protein WDO73_17775 [Ignavibacteriota bacterium]